MATLQNKIEFALQLADNALILGHRLSEWCGHGPVLEQDIALTNMALDHLGQARSLFQYTAEKIRQSPESAPDFSSVALKEKNNQLTEDDLAYLRDAWDFKNLLLTEQPNQDWAYTIARSFYYDHFMTLLYAALESHADENLAAIAEKSLKEAYYHKRWSSEWVIRLGDGTEESHQRIKNAINDLWVYTGELFVLSTGEKAVLEVCGTDAADLQASWKNSIVPVLGEAGLDQPPEDAWMHTGGKKGRHSEHLGYLLAEMQYMQRTYPDMQW